MATSSNKTIWNFHFPRQKQGAALIYQVSKMDNWLVFGISILVFIPSVSLAFVYNCDNCGLSSIPSFIPPETTELRLGGNQISSISRNSLNTLQNIMLLVISRNILTNVEVDSFSGLNITTLTMSYNQLTSVPHIEPLAHSLSILYLDRNRISTIEQYAFRNFTALKRLYLIRNLITSLSDFALHILRTKMYSFYLDYNRINTLGDRAFAETTTLYLRMNRNALTEFPCLKDITRVYTLYLNNNPISTAPLDCGPSWNTIRLVQLRGTLLTSLDNITNNAPNLNRLEVGGTPVTFSDDTFRGTSLTYIIMRDVSWLPQFHSSKLTLGYLELGGIDLRCIDEAWLDGMINLRTFKLLQTSVDLLPNTECSNNTSENRTVLGYFQSLQTLVIQNSPLINFPNLTSYGNNASLYHLEITKSRISSVPCFPENFELYNLFIINLIENQINHICNMNFAPNIRNLLLSRNPLFNTLFIEPPSIPFSQLYRIEIESIGMESLSDSVLSVIHNSGELISGSNEINLFPNIKLISRNVVAIDLNNNSIPSVPCTSLGKMEKLTSLKLADNVITFMCDMLLTWAPNLATLNLSRNQLLEIADLRGPTRMLPTRVWLDSNPLRCLTSMCWMLFVSQDRNLQLHLQNTQCLDGDDIKRDMITGLTTECTCKLMCLFSDQDYCQSAFCWSVNITYVKIINIGEEQYIQKSTQIILCFTNYVRVQLNIDA